MGEQPNLFDADVLKGTDGLRVLRDRALMCRKCKLHETRTNVVYGVGNTESPPIVFVGEAPGENEDLKGEPFIGRAGQLLTKMIEAMGLSRERVYICNVVGCRPPDNRRPEKSEVAACKEHIVGQIRHIKPQIIVALGGSAAQALLKSEKTIGELRGRWFEWEGVPLRCTYHPAYLLREQKKKKEAWADLQLVQQRIQAMDSYGNGQGQGDGHGRSTETSDSSQGNGRDGGEPPVPESSTACSGGDPPAVRDADERPPRDKNPF
jgi:uracil-DNA glycosylase family 4